MDPTSVAALRRLITDQRVLSLAVLVDSKPAIGLLPYVPLPDLSSVLVVASALARHTRGLHQGALFSILIYGQVDDPLQVVRATFDGTVSVLEKGSDEYQRDRSLFVQRLPESEVLFTLADFTLYSLPLHHGRFVQGFARAADVSPNDLQL